MGLNIRHIFRSATKYQEKIMWVIFLSTLTPLAMMGIAFYVFIQQVKASFPESQYTALFSIPLFSDYFLIALCLFLPPCLGAVWLYAYYISCRLVGPIERVEKELKQRVTENSTDPIHLRKGDMLSDFVNTINQLLKK